MRHNLLITSTTAKLLNEAEKKAKEEAEKKAQEEEEAKTTCSYDQCFGSTLLLGHVA